LIAALAHLREISRDSEGWCEILGRTDRISNASAVSRMELRILCADARGACQRGGSCGQQADVSDPYRNQKK
jgi:hypothetical protein